MSQTEINPEMTAAYQDSIKRSIEIAIDAVQHDYSRRVPRTEEERQNEFAAWFEKYRAKCEPLMQSAVQEAFANIAVLDALTVKEYVQRYVWPEVAHWLLHTYVLRGQVAKWVSHHYGGATTIGMPEAHGDCWRVPLGVHNVGENMGQVVLDRDGNIIEAQTSTRQQILEKIRDRKLSAAETAA